jgi:hypothetical protein
MNSITNIDQIIATRDLCKQIMAGNGLNLDVFEVSYPNKNLPDEFLVVKSIAQSDDGRPINDGTVETCIYVANLKKGNDQSQPNLARISELTDIFIPGIKDASKNKIAFNDFRTMLVNDSEIRYFYQSIVINTVGINV